MDLYKIRAKISDILIAWTKRLLRFDVLVAVFSLAASAIGITEYVEKNGGTFLAKINGKEAVSPVDRTVLVYMDKDSVDLSHTGVYPQITNPSKYALQDVLVTYKIDSDSADVAYSDYYTVHKIIHGYEATNVDKTLYAKSELPNPFYCFVLKDDGQATINIRATYKGVEEPFFYKANVYAKKVAKELLIIRRHLLFKDALRFLSKSDKSKIDIYLLRNEKVESFPNMSRKALLAELPHTYGVAPSPHADSDSIAASESQSNNELEASDNTNSSASNKEGKTFEDYTPWYMKGAGVAFFLLCIFTGALMLGMMILFFREKGIRSFYYFCGTLISAFSNYLSLHYFLLVFRPDRVGDFWLGLVFFYCNVLLYLIGISLYRRISRRVHNTIEALLVKFLFIISFLAIIYFLLIIFE